MNWNCFDFDPSDKFAHIYLKYKGGYYDKGTIVKLYGRNGPITARFLGWNYKDRNCFEALNDSDRVGMYNNYTRADTNKYILEIVMPVKPNLQQTEASTGRGGMPDRERPPSWDVEVAWIWYIVIMAVVTIFKDRLMIWAFASAVFFLWKNGFLNNKKK